jgi:hypothetical protein
MTTMTINAFDVRTPREALVVMNSIAATYLAFYRNSQAALQSQTAARVTGAPLAFVTQIAESDLTVKRTAETAAAEFAREVEAFERNVAQAAGGSLADTQAGGYGDQSRN